MSESTPLTAYERQELASFDNAIREFLAAIDRGSDIPAQVAQRGLVAVLYMVGGNGDMRDATLFDLAHAVSAPEGVLNDLRLKRLDLELDNEDLAADVVEALQNQSALLCAYAEVDLFGQDAEVAAEDITHIDKEIERVKARYSVSDVERVGTIPPTRILITNEPYMEAPEPGVENNW